MRTRRYGKFKVHGRFFARLEQIDGKITGANLFRGMIVLRVDNDAMADEMTYYAVHPSFRDLPEGEIVPEYTAKVFDRRGSPVWEEVPPYKVNLAAVADEAYSAAIGKGRR